MTDAKKKEFAAEFVKKPIEVRIYGNEVTLNRPMFGQARRIQMAAKSGDNELDILKDILVECGLPSELLDQMEAGHVNQLHELLLDSKKN